MVPFFSGWRPSILPLFGVYTALQATHQGHRRFFRLGLSQAAYALAKLVGVLLIIGLGISLQQALLVNASASLVGVLLLLPGTGLRTQGRWLVRESPIGAIAVPMGLYAISLYSVGSLNLWILQAMTPASEGAMVGVFVAALNIARVPGFALSTVSAGAIALSIQGSGHGGCAARQALPASGPPLLLHAVFARLSGFNGQA